MEYGDADREHTLRLVPGNAASVLDVGSGSGHFLETLKRRQPHTITWAIDANQDCSQRPGVDNFVRGIYPEAAPREQFDVVVFNDVLEHLVDPWSALRDTHGYLSPDGVVIASIPNIRHYSVIKPLVAQGRFTYREMGLLDRTHLRFFTFSSACDLFETTGFTIRGQLILSGVMRLGAKGAGGRGRLGRA